MTTAPDLRLPDWGPYTKRYIGVSHIADAARGLRFDLSVFPGFYRHKIDVPNVLWESGYSPWAAAPDLSYYSHRHELSGSDELYCDIAFAHLDDDARLIRATFVNRTNAPQNLVLHQMASLNFPPPKAYVPEPLRPATIELPPGAGWLDALDYAGLTFAQPRPTDTLNADGLRRAETRDHGFVGGGGIGQGFGAAAGDTVTFRFTIPRPIPAPLIVARYRLGRETVSPFSLGLDGAARRVCRFVGTGDFRQEGFSLGDTLPAGEHTLRFTALGGASIEFDGFAIVAARDANRVRFAQVEWHPRPEIVAGPQPQSLLLRYADPDRWYGLAWDFAPWEVREFHTAELDSLLRSTVHHHTRDQFYGSGEGHYTNIFCRPIVLAPGETRTLHGLVCTGERAAIERQINAYHADTIDPASHFVSAETRAADLTPSPAGSPFRTSQERLAATLLTNVVYPVYARRRYIRHNTPGRWWDSLYTWDSGFIGLGLAELDRDRALDCLRAYLMPPDDPDAAFLHHGSPVPTQHALFHDLWNRAPSLGLLRECYPSLRQYWRFLAGMLGSSTTARFGSGLLQTWDYFYNSGGWDDYPPQVAVHAQGLAGSVTPVITTAQVVRVAKILRHAAKTLELDADVVEYDALIAASTRALQRHAWDESSGYFGYVRHDAAGAPIGILRHEGDENFNRGFDGLYPLIAGICTPDQEERLLAHLFDPARHWTPIGLTAVDQSAPYYRADGYWNGAVWMAHQWYFWRTMLDLGRPDLARQIAMTALDLWRVEVERTGRTFEHFIVASGRGAGWHHFGGLSAPILNWYAAYYRPGTLTVGFDTWLHERSSAPDHTALTATMTIDTATHHRPTLIATLAPGPRYVVRWNDTPLDYDEPLPGVLEISLPAGASAGRLVIDTD
ncbi:MAG TPA: hypothetical protein VIL85_10465 [Thermomicrobiales bacterium]|jgi:hypothetical protein